MQAFWVDLFNRYDMNTQLAVLKQHLFVASFSFGICQACFYAVLEANCLWNKPRESSGMAGLYKLYLIPIQPGESSGIVVLNGRWQVRM
jgi:hypothetical protein